jgi:hypothetical protein
MPIRAYFEDNYKELKAILAALFQTGDPPDLARIIAERYTAVLCILLHLEKGSYIKFFTEHRNMDDQHLPFAPSMSRAYFPESFDPRFLELFCAQQWRFCYPTFDRHRLWYEEFHGKLILPIMDKVLDIRKNAILHRIRVHGVHNKLISDEDKAVRPLVSLRAAIVKYD